MIIFDIVKSRIKIALRQRELYLYVVGFPLIFLIIYGSMAPFYYPTISTMHIGFTSDDLGVSYKLGDSVLFDNYSELLYEYLDSLYYESQSVKVFSIENISSISEAERKVARLSVVGVVYIPQNFSEIIYNASTLLTYTTIAPILIKEINNAYITGDIELAERYISALREVSEFSNNTFSINVIIIGDPTYSKAMELYEAMWKHITNFVFRETNKFTHKYVNYLERRYNITIKINEASISIDMNKTFNVQFRRVGQRSVKETFLQMYYSSLIPGQIIQSIMIASVSAIFMVGYEINNKIIDRLKLTKITSIEYIGGTLIVWGIMSLVLSSILLATSIAFGYIKVAWSLLDITLSLIILILAGIITAAYSLIFISFTDEKVAGNFSLITLLTLSLFIAGYFPAPNPVIAYFLGREITFFDFVPWRTAITGLRKTLILTNIYEPQDVLPDLALLILWTVIYSMLAFIIFNKLRLKKKE